MADSTNSARQHASGGVRRVAIICGTVYAFDAISECALACLDAASSGGNAVDVRVYCLDTNVDDSRIHVVASLRDLLAEPFYQYADVIIHHFGIMSDLHLALGMAPRSAHVIVQFYGITPPQFMPKQMQLVIAESFVQMGLFEHVDEIVVNSGYLADEVRRIGVTRSIRQLDLFGVNIAPKALAERQARVPDRSDHGSLDIVYCGRFVRSKQVLPIIEALDAAFDRLPPVHLRLIGVVEHSDAGYLEELRGMIDAARITVTLVTNETSEDVSARIAAADLLVLPSLHEGFGMPVAEALAVGTPVVCSDAGSLPEVAGGFAALFPAQDLMKFAAVLEAALSARANGKVLTTSGRLPYADWARDAQRFASKYRRAAFVDRWRALVIETLAIHASPNLAPAARADALLASFASKSPHATNEALLLGRFVGLKAASRLINDPHGAIDIFHRWAFGRSMDENESKYWQARLGSSAELSEIVDSFASAHEVRSSSMRIRSLAGLKGSLSDVMPASTLDPDVIQTSRYMNRSEIEIILNHSSSNLDFVKDAYRLILRREADLGGLMMYTSLLNASSERNEIVDTLYNSTEFASMNRSAVK